MDISDLKAKISQLKAEIEEKKTRVNFKVDAMFEDTQSQYSRLLLKKDTLEENKKSVEETIEFLNEKKNEDKNYDDFISEFKEMEIKKVIDLVKVTDEDIIEIKNPS